MKKILVNLACFVIGIVLAVTAMTLISNRNSEPDIGKPGPITKSEPKKTESPVQQAEDIPDAQEKSTALSPESPEPDEMVTLSEAEQFQALMGKVFSGQATPDEELAFWEQLRTSEAINDLIAEQESGTSLESDDIQSHMNLANLYVAKILSVPAGPEKGLWGMKAMERWKTVLELDPNHWDAQYSVAFSLSQYPDFLNKTGEAISEYEKLVVLQRDQEPEPNQAKVYLELYRLYQKRGDQANAYDTIQEGLERFPDNQQLIEQQNSISVIQ